MGRSGSQLTQNIKHASRTPLCGSLSDGCPSDHIPLIDVLQGRRPKPTPAIHTCAVLRIASPLKNTPTIPSLWPAKTGGSYPWVGRRTFEMRAGLRAVLSHSGYNTVTKSSRPPPCKAVADASRQRRQSNENQLLSCKSHTHTRTWLHTYYFHDQLLSTANKKKFDRRPDQPTLCGLSEKTRATMSFDATATNLESGLQSRSRTLSWHCP